MLLLTEFADVRSIASEPPFEQIKSVRVNDEHSMPAIFAEAESILAGTLERRM